MTVGQRERERISWIEDFIFIDASLSAENALQKIQETKAPWVVISRYGGTYLYAFTIDELWRWPALRDARAKLSNWLSVPFETVLDLHEEFQSTPSESRDNPPPIDRSWRPTATAPSIARYIQIDQARMPCAVGYPTATRQTRRAKPPAPPAPPPAVEAPPVSPPAASATEDEGTTPVRYPSIETDKPLGPGARITALIDLMRTPTDHTQGGAVDLGLQVTLLVVDGKDDRDVQLVGHRRAGYGLG